MSRILEIYRVPLIGQYVAIEREKKSTCRVFFRLCGCVLGRKPCRYSYRTIDKGETTRVNPYRRLPQYKVPPNHTISLEPTQSEKLGYQITELVVYYKSPLSC